MPKLSQIQLDKILFWFMDNFILNFNPRLQRVSCWIKYNYYKIPRAKIIKLFDDYAENFEEHLIQVLEYNTPTELAKFIYDHTHLKPTINTALDLGCGTGLAGLAIKKQFSVNRLIGVDLSWKMLKNSKNKNVYNELHNADLVEFLQNSACTFDLIISSDVLIYVGELRFVMLEVHQRLRTGGYFAFSVEALDSGDFSKTTAGRFQHSINYLNKLSSETGFVSFKFSTVFLRKEFGDMVPGYLILIKK